MFLGRYERFARGLAVGVLILCLGPAGVPDQKDYAPRKLEEADLVSLIVNAEINANRWAKSELLCLRGQNRRKMVNSWI